MQRKTQQSGFGSRTAAFCFDQSRLTSCRSGRARARWWRTPWPRPCCPSPWSWTTRSRERRLGSVSWSWMDTRLASLIFHVLGVEHLHHDDILIRHRAVVDQIVHAAQRMTAVNEIFSHIETLLTLIPIPAHSTIACAACQPNRAKCPGSLFSTLGVFRNSGKIFTGLR